MASAAKSIPASRDAAAAACDVMAEVVVVVAAGDPDTPGAPGFNRLDSFLRLRRPAPPPEGEGGTNCAGGLVLGVVEGGMGGGAPINGLDRASDEPPPPLWLVKSRAEDPVCEAAGAGEEAGFEALVTSALGSV